MSRKFFISFLSGIVILFITLIYQNSDFSRAIEDGFFKQISLLWTYKVYPNPKNTADFVFINSGKDLELVEDTEDWGNISVSDRSKIYRLIKLINNTPQKPLFTVLDIQFYYPYTINPQIDSLLGQELTKNKRLVIPVFMNENGGYKNPLFNAEYASSEYRTFGTRFNKFKILNQDSVKSLPVRLDELVNNSIYKDRWLFSTCNGKLCFSAIWPGYYLNNDDVMAPVSDTTLENIGKEDDAKNKKKISTQYYNLGEILLVLEADPENASNFFENKIAIIGNFQEDIHTTAVGKMSGPIILANIYLSLLNNQHIISFGFLFTLLLAFSALSYLALFSKMPKLKMNEKIVPSYLSKLIRKYLTYFGCMFLLSLICFFLFQVQVALFLPSFIFAEIETRHKTKESFVNFLSFLKKKFLSLKNYIQRLAKKDKKTGVKKGAFKIKNDT